MLYRIYDSQGALLNGGTTGSTGGSGSSGSTGGSVATYDRMDIGGFFISGQVDNAMAEMFYPAGDPQQGQTVYPFPRDGYVLGVSLFGNPGAAVTAGVNVFRYNDATNNSDTVMNSNDAGNGQTWDPTLMQLKGLTIMAPSPIPFKKGDAAQMQLYISDAASSLLLTISAYLLVALNPQ